MSTQSAWASLNDRILKCRSADARHNPRQSIELRMEVITENVENCSIRVDSVTQQGSAIDVVRMVLQCNSSTANTYLGNLKGDFPELGKQVVEQYRINGKGRPTPVADAKTLIEIAMLLPGKASAKFRRTSATTVCRVVGGDIKLIDEIEQNDQKWKSIEGGLSMQQALLKRTNTWKAMESVDTEKPPGVNECSVRDHIALVVGGEIEVQTPVGFIDVLSPNEVIEVKYFKQWKHGLGQVLAYHSYYPRLDKRLHLFAHNGDVNTERVLALAKLVCETHSVEVTFEEIKVTTTVIGVKMPREGHV